MKADKKNATRLRPSERAAANASLPDWAMDSSWVIGYEAVDVEISERDGIDRPLVRFKGQSKRNARLVLPVAELEKPEYREMARHEASTRRALFNNPASLDYTSTRVRAGQISGKARHPDNCPICAVLRQNPPRLPLKKIQRELEGGGISVSVQAIGQHRKAILKANTGT